MKDRPAEPTGGRMAAVVLLLHLLILVALITHFDYWKLFSLRHVMILAGLSLPFSAAGLAVLLELVPAAKRRGASIALVLGLTGPTLPWMLETRFADDVYLRRAGEWIGAQGPSPFRVMTTRHRVAFYARGIQVWCPSEPDPAWILAEAREHKPDWLVFDETRQFKEQPSFFEGLKAAAVAGETLELVHAVESGGRKPTRALIYRYHPPS